MTQQKVYCGQMNQYSRDFMREICLMCSRSKMKGIIQTLQKSQSQTLSWYGIVSLLLATLIYTSVILSVLSSSFFLDPAGFWQEGRPFTILVLLKISSLLKRSFYCHCKALHRCQHTVGSVFIVTSISINYNRTVS